MTTEIIEKNTSVRIEWRHDGRYGYRDTDLAEIRFWVREGFRTNSLNECLSAETPEGTIRLVDGCFVRLPSNARLIPPKDGDLASQFIRAVERLI